MAKSMLYSDTLTFTEDTLENIYEGRQKIQCFRVLCAVYSGILKDDVFREKMSSPSRLRIHLPRAEASIFFSHCVLSRQGGKRPKS